MNLFKDYNFQYFLALALVTSLVAVIAKFDGTVSVNVTPLGLQVEVHNDSKCLIKRQNIQPQLPAPELT